MCDDNEDDDDNDDDSSFDREILEARVYEANTADEIIDAMVFGQSESDDESVVDSNNDESNSEEYISRI